MRGGGSSRREIFRRCVHSTSGVRSRLGGGPEERGGGGAGSREEPAVEDLVKSQTAASEACGTVAGLAI